MTQWAGYHERIFQGQKFEVAQGVQRGRLPTSFQPTLEGLRQDLDQTSLRGTTTVDDTIDEDFGSKFFCEDESAGDY